MSRFGYKAMYSDSCLYQTYEVGKTYKIIPNIKPSEKSPKPYPIKNNVLGFHYCVEPDEVVFYYDIKSRDFTLYEVEDLNPNDLEFGKRFVTDEIKIIRRIERDEYHEIFKKTYFELGEISRIYVWKNNAFGNFQHMINRIEIK